ncbi:Ig-like domain-containing protein, partial [candidate division WOR-3 bacterium]|nr:Ig-like domain-containing protein [candidate division WOR-3 bacterium]
VGADESTIDATTAMLLETNSGEVVELSDVDYDDDTTSTEFSRLVLKPNANLKPGTTYTLRLLGAIADDVGIKLDEGNYVAYEEDFTTRCCTHDSSEIADDIEPPYVVGWDVIDEPGYADAFEVEFSEEIDPSTIALSTVYLSSVGYGNGVLTIRNEAGHTIVRFTRGDGGNVYSYTGWVSAEVKDIAGNRKGSTSSHWF